MSTQAAPRRIQRSMRKNITVAIAGSAIEWYDFFIYATASALVLNKLFFPSYSDTAGTVLALSTFAVGFLVRPMYSEGRGGRTPRERTADWPDPARTRHPGR